MSDQVFSLSGFAGDDQSVAVFAIDALEASGNVSDIFVNARANFDLVDAASFLRCFKG